MAHQRPTPTHRRQPAQTRPLRQTAHHREDLASAERRSPDGQPQWLLALQRTLGNASVGRLLAGREQLSAASGGAPIQRFGGKEHRNIGDWATNRKLITLGSKGYTLSYGEVVALAGDLFPSLAYMEKLADKPGPGPYTQEALDYARYIKIGRRRRQDARTESQQVADDTDDGFPDEEKKYDPNHYSKATRKAVDEMYYKLASDNASHFAAPRGKDAGKAAQDRPDSAGASYRENHEEALRRACLAGKRGESGMPALAAEAFGDHFLTDAISAGHIRTPRLDIISYWDKRDPGLFPRFKAYLIMQVIDWVRSSSKKYGAVPIQVMAWKVAKGVDEALAARPKLTLGVLVNLAVHDYDSLHGLDVLSGGKRAKVFGDGHLAEGDTEKIGIAAVRAGADEVRQAYKLGGEGKTLAEIKAILLEGGTQYKAELLVPRLDPAAGEQTMPRWAVETLEQLLADGPMKEALALTIRNNVAEIVEVANGMPEPGKSGVIEGFAKVVERDPIRALRNIYAYNPDSGINLHNLGVTGVELPTH